MALKQETIEYRKINNLCPKCGQSNVENRKMCPKHLAQESVRSNRNQKKRRIVRKAKGICSACGKQEAADGKALCVGCNSDVNERSIKLTKRRANDGVCIDCGKQPPRDGLTTCDDCRDFASKRQANRRRNLTYLNMCPVCGDVPPLQDKKWCQTCYDTRNQWYAKSNYRDRYTVIRAEDKRIVFEHYGNECSCCGETEPCFLAIDHIDGGGNEHRKAIGKAGSGFYRWLINNQFPDGFQVLCHNCNMGKHLNDGICPHRMKQLSGGGN